MARPSCWSIDRRRDRSRTRTRRLRTPRKIVLDAWLVFLVFWKYENRRHCKIRGYVRGVGGRATASDRQAPAFGASRRVDRRRSSDRTRYSEFDALAPSGKTQNGRARVGAQGQTVAVVFRECRCVAGSARVSVCRMLHAQQRSRAGQDNFGKSSKIEFANENKAMTFVARPV